MYSPTTPPVAPVAVGRVDRVVNVVVRRTRATRRLLVVSAIVVGGLSSCGDEAAVSTERPLTFDEASMLANVQRLNALDGGAVVEVVSSFLIDGSTVSMRAEVDWSTHTGHALVVATGTEQAIAEVFWNDTTVFERIPSLDPLLAGRGAPSIRYVARPADTENRQLDRAIALLVGLAAEAPDNPVLLQQKEGSAFLRDDVLRGEAVTVLRFGQQTVYWLDAGGAMHRFEGNSAAKNAPIIVDVYERGAQQITFPDPSTVIAVDAIRELYDAVVS